MPRVQVEMFLRRPMAQYFSVERLFADVRHALPADIGVTAHVLPFESRGVLRRLGNLVFVWRRRGEINHVAGDVHYVVLALPRRSTVLTILDITSLHRLRGIRRFVVRVLWYDLPVRRAALVTTISEWTRDELAGVVRGSADKTIVIPCPVSPHLRPSEPRQPDPPVALLVGTKENKNLPRVVEAVEGLPLHLRVIGHLDDEQHALLERSATPYSSAEDLSDAQLATEYAECSFLVFPSTYEGFGLPILEAQASARPVITSRAASMPEVAGDGALLVDPFDIGEIRDAVQTLLQDPTVSRALVERGLRNVERFRSSAVSTRYSEAYRTVRTQLNGGSTSVIRQEESE